MNIQTSTRANLAAAAGNVTLLAAYAADTADLLRGDDTVTTDDEQAVLTAALTAGLTIAARRTERAITGSMIEDYIEDAAQLAAEAVAATRAERPTGMVLTDAAAYIAEAIAFQLTDEDEQD